MCVTARGSQAQRRESNAGLRKVNGGIVGDKPVNKLVVEGVGGEGGGGGMRARLQVARDESVGKKMKVKVLAKGSR